MVLLIFHAGSSCRSLVHGNQSRWILCGKWIPTQCYLELKYIMLKRMLSYYNCRPGICCICIVTIIHVILEDLVSLICSKKSTMYINLFRTCHKYTSFRVC